MNKKIVWDIESLEPTEWSTVEDKIKFGNQFIKFMESGFDKSQFPKWFYTRLSMCFGHIAHYDQSGFYRYFFERGDYGAEFIKQCLDYPCYGSPKFTYCDIEKQIQQRIRKLIEEKNNKKRKWFQQMEKRIDHVARMDEDSIGVLAYLNLEEEYQKAFPNSRFLADYYDLVKEMDEQNNYD